MCKFNTMYWFDLVQYTDLIHLYNMIAFVVWASHHIMIISSSASVFILRNICCYFLIIEERYVTEILEISEKDEKNKIKKN